MRIVKPLTGQRICDNGPTSRRVARRLSISNRDAGCRSKHPRSNTVPVANPPKLSDSLVHNPRQVNDTIHHGAREQLARRIRMSKSHVFAKPAVVAIMAFNSSTV